MKQIKVNLTPLNTTFSSGLNSFMTFSEDKYTSNTQRSVLVKNPLESYFKFKVGSLMPYIEYPLMGCVNGDIITVDFDYKVNSETIVYIEVYELTENYTTHKKYYYEVKLDKLNTWENAKLSIPLKKTIKTSIGFNTNIRIINGVDVELKNINLTLNTNNNNCDLNKEFIKIDNKNLFDYTSRVTLQNKIGGDDYTKGIEILESVRTLNDDYVKFKSDIADFKFKGLVFRLSEMNKPSSAIYVKYSSNMENTCGFRATNPTTGKRYSGKVTLPNTNGVISEVIVRGLLQSDFTIPPKDVIVEISNMDMCDINIYKVICDNSCISDNSNTNDLFKSNSIQITV